MLMVMGVIGIILLVLYLLIKICEMWEKDQGIKPKSYTNIKSKESDLMITTYRYEYNCMYLGGFKNIAGGKSSTLRFNPNYLHIIFSGEKINITKENIKSMEIITNQQLSQEVSLGKLIIFGLLAFAMRDTKTQVKNFLLIKCTYVNEDINLLFELKASDKIEECIDCYYKYYAR